MDDTKTEEARLRQERDQGESISIELHTSAYLRQIIRQYSPYFIGEVSLQTHAAVDAFFQSCVATAQDGVGRTCGSELTSLLETAATSQDTAMDSRIVGGLVSVYNQLGKAYIARVFKTSGDFKAALKQHAQQLDTARNPK